MVGRNVKVKLMRNLWQNLILATSTSTVNLVNIHVRLYCMGYTKLEVFKGLAVTISHDKIRNYIISFSAKAC